MALPPGYRRTPFDSVGGTFACGLILTVAVVLLARFLALGHL
jgi:hypothetical protein